MKKNVFSKGKDNFFRRKLKSGARLIGEFREADTGGTFYFKYPFGGLHTMNGDSGGAHVLEHLAFKDRESAENRSAYDLLVAIGGQTNAGTSFTETDFHVRTSLRHFDHTFKYLGILLRKPEILQADLDKELETIKLEMSRSHDHPEEHLHELAFHSIFEGATDHSIFGTPNSVSSFTPKDIQRFWYNGYNPSNLVISYVGGSIPLDDLSRKLDESLFVSNKDRSKFRNSETPILKGRPLRLNEKRKGLDQAYVSLAVPSVGFGSPKYLAFELLTDFLTELDQAKIFDLIRNKSALSYRVNGTIDSNIYYIDAGTYPSKVPNVLNLMKKGFYDATKISLSEFNSVKERAIGKFEAEEYSSLELSERLTSFEIAGRNAELHYSYADQLKRVTLEQFREAARVPYFGEVIISPK